MCKLTEETKRHLRKFIGDYSIGFYAGAASAIFLFTYEILTKYNLSYWLRLIILIIVGLIIYVSLGLAGFSIYLAVKKRMRKKE